MRTHTNIHIQIAIKMAIGIPYESQGVKHPELWSVWFVALNIVPFGEQAYL